LAVLKEVLMASISSGFNLEREYQIRNTPKAIGSMVKMIFLELNFKNYVNEFATVVALAISPARGTIRFTK